MENFPGIISLFLVCVEFVLLINLFIFAEKNSVNKIIIGIVGLLLGYQSFEFVICYFGVESNLIVYLAFVVISFLPLLLLNLVMTIRNDKALIRRIIFIPIMLLLFYYHHKKLLHYQVCYVRQMRLLHVKFPPSDHHHQLRHKYNDQES